MIIMLLLNIQQGYVEKEDTDNVEEFFDNIMKEAEYGDSQIVITMHTFNH